MGQGLFIISLEVTSKSRDCENCYYTDRVVSSVLGSCGRMIVACLTGGNQYS
jgi:hypothetical protein